MRAARLDESLHLLDAFWTGQPVTFHGEYLTAAGVTMLPRPVQRPRIPVWCGGRWPNKRPFRRAARWDGVMPIHTGYGLGETMPPAELRAVVAYTREHRTGAGPFDVALEGRTDGSAADRGGQLVASYARAGLTWWVEALGWWRGHPAEAMSRIRQGPRPSAESPGRQLAGAIGPPPSAEAVIAGTAATWSPAGSARRSRRRRRSRRWCAAPPCGRPGGGSGSRGPSAALPGRRAGCRAALAPPARWAAGCRSGRVTASASGTSAIQRSRWWRAACAANRAPTRLTDPISVWAPEVPNGDRPPTNQTTPAAQLPGTSADPPPTG